MKNQLNKIQNFLEPALAHFGAGCFITIILSLLNFNLFISFFAVLLAGISKELIDLYIRHTGFNVLDIVFTLLGWVAILVIF